MMSSSNFRLLVVEPAAAQFRIEPTSLLHAHTIIWSIDAYASHVAFERAPASIREDTKKRRRIEEDFKRDLISSSKIGAWQFRIVREVSNAAKHAVRSTTELGVKASDALSTQNIVGWLWYFMGAHAEHWGDQIIVELDLQRDDVINAWIDEEGRPFRGPVFKWVTILSLIEPSLALIEGGP